VYRLTIQQGNIVSQEMIDKLKPGMTKSQIQFILGNPILQDSLDQDRWNYIYSLHIPGSDLVQRELVIYFEENRLSHFEGDYIPSENSKSQPDG
jgi:outer membrane protein assembly factor BamE